MGSRSNRCRLCGELVSEERLVRGMLGSICDGCVKAAYVELHTKGVTMGGGKIIELSAKKQSRNRE